MLEVRNLSVEFHTAGGRVKAVPPAVRENRGWRFSTLAGGAGAA